MDQTITSLPFASAMFVGMLICLEIGRRKMIEVQAGLGMGVKKFRTIFVFETKEAMDQFVNAGWEFGGQATAAAKTSDKGVHIRAQFP